MKLEKINFDSDKVISLFVVFIISANNIRSLVCVNGGSVAECAEKIVS